MSDKQKVYEILDAPRDINIKEYKYTFKKELKNESFSYRCIHRKCQALISMSKSEIKKIINKKDDNIKITYTNTHNLDVHKIILYKIESKDNITIEKNNYDLAKNLIKSSLNKPLQWHITNLKNNEFNLSKNQIKYLLYKYRNEQYPKDSDFLVNVINTNISFDKNEDNATPFCYSDYKYIYKDKKKLYIEKFIIFTCLFLIKIFASSKKIFIDATFKITPTPFYQTLIIIAQDSKSNLKYLVFLFQ